MVKSLKDYLDPPPNMKLKKKPSYHRSMSESSDLSSVHADLRSFMSRDESKSQLSLNVNDSATMFFREVYDKQEILGEGGFAVVRRCIHKARGNAYAVKEIENEAYEAGEGNTIREEIKAMKRLKEIPYIVRLLDVFKEFDKTFLVMEEMKGGDLLDKLGTKEYYKEEEGRRLSRRLMEAIYYCHRKNIVHRDIKPENILLESPNDDTKIRLADFGCSKQLKDDTVLHTMCGTPQYVAPEVYTDSKIGYDERCDLWSAGVVIYLCLGGYLPFDGDPHELPNIIVDGYYEFHDKYWADISDPPKLMIESLLQVNPERRATIETILDTGWLRRPKPEKALSFRSSSSRSINLGEDLLDDSEDP